MATPELEPLSTYAPREVLDRLNDAAFIERRPRCRIVTEALDKALPSLEEISQMLAGRKARPGREHSR